MHIRINPFQPNSPVFPSMFVGRLRELERLEYHLLQTRAGNPAGFMILGERGIGKSSLLQYLQYVAQGSIPIQGQSLRFLVINTDIDQNVTQMGLVRKIELGLRHAIQNSDKALGALQKLWAFLRLVEVAGSSIRDSRESNPTETAIEEAAYSLANTWSGYNGQDAGSSLLALRGSGRQEKF